MYQGKARTKGTVFEESFPAQTLLALSVLVGAFKKKHCIAVDLRNWDPLKLWLEFIIKIHMDWHHL